MKFRIWDRLERRMYYSNSPGSQYFSISLKGEIYNLHTGAGGDDYVLQRFTGLKDINQKDIYEGDICKFYTQEHHNEIIDSVVFSEGQWEMKEYCVGLFDCLWDQRSPGIWLEVIGNIYENPELT